MGFSLYLLSLSKTGGFMQEETQEQMNWRTKFILIGGILGAVVGSATAYLMARTAEENQSGPPAISTSDAVKAAVAVIGTVRGIAALGDRK
jgi:hypothetical protein